MIFESFVIVFPLLCFDMDFDYMTSAAYGEYVTIDEMLSKVKIGSGCELQESDPLGVINRQDAYGLTMLMEGRARRGV